jgi:uncharacterized protein
MRIWIDMDNSPHVLLFAPLIRELRRTGMDFLLTVRDFSQTRRLAEQHGLEFTTVGRHCQSSSLARKVTSTLGRAWQLRQMVAKHGVAAAVSHGSRAMILAARTLGLPILTLDDYEFSSVRLQNIVSDRILVPEVIPEARLAAQGLNLRKLVRYPGLKEEVYVYDFKPDVSVLEKLRLDPHRVIVTVRPPATWAHYHESLGDMLFRALLNRLEREPGIQVMVLARTESQAVELRERYGLFPEKFNVSAQAVDGLSLMWFSDAVFSGGGTMVREAALLGLNVHSFFGGRIAAADEYLVSQGRLRLLREASEIDTLPLPTKRTERPVAPSGRSMAPFVADEILRFVRDTSGARFQQEEASVKATKMPERTPEPPAGGTLVAVEGASGKQHRSS